MGRFIAEKTLTRSIADLHALGDNRQRPQYIETIAKRGYRPVAPVSGVVHADRSRERAAPQEPSLLVLPFTNFGPETDKYFCEGLTDEVINALDVRELRVISRTSAFAAHARGGDIADIGKAWG